MDDIIKRLRGWGLTSPETSTGLMKEAADEIERLRDTIDCGCNALTDSINVSGNDPNTNMHWVRKMRRALER